MFPEAALRSLGQSMRLGLDTMRCGRGIGKIAICIPKHSYVYIYILIFDFYLHTGFVLKPPKFEMSRLRYVFPCTMVPIVLICSDTIVIYSVLIY